MLNLSKITADLCESKELISVYGNFALAKKALSLPEYLGNQMGKEDLVIFATKNGQWHELGESNGYKVEEIKIGTGRILVAYNETEIRFVIGV